MRVLHVDGEPGFRGGQRQLFMLAEAQASEPTSPEPTCLVRSKRLAELLRGAGIEARLWSGPSSPRGAAQLRQALSTESGAILHAHCARSHGAIRVLASRIEQRRLVVHRRIDNPPGRGPLDRAKYAVGRFVCVSSAVAQELRKAGVSASRIHVVPSATPLANTPMPAPLRETTRFDRLSLLAVGALVPHKGHDLLIRGMALARDEHSLDTKLTIVGDGPRRQQLQSLADSLGLSEFLNLVDYSDESAEAGHREAGLFVQPSRTEGLGSAVLDAMARGLPVLASPVGGLVELVGEGRGALAASASPIGLAEALVRFAEERARAPSTIQSRRHAAWSWVQAKHSPSAMLAGVCSVYDVLDA